MFVCVFKSDKKCWSGNNVKETDGQEIFALKLKTVTYITINYETRRKKKEGRMGQEREDRDSVCIRDCI